MIGVTLLYTYFYGMNKLLVLILLLGFSAKAQLSINITLKDSVSKETLPFVSVLLDDSTHTGGTDTNGKIIFKNINPGKHLLKTFTMGYEPGEFIFSLNEDSSVTFFLHSANHELEEVIVSSTRTNHHIEDEAQRMEVIGKDEIDEESTIVPDNIGSLLGDMAGLQLQQTSAISGASAIRIQGLGEQYTQTRKDGLPLFNGFSGSIGFLDIPPLDLKQVEILKGPSSVLFGAGAIAGMINLISAEPVDSTKLTALVSENDLGKLNADFYYSSKKKKTAFTIFAAGSTQKAKDRGNDGLSDSPDQNQFQFHPQFFLYGKNNQKLKIGYSLNFTDLKGGDMECLAGRGDSIHSYFEKDKSTRNSIDLFYSNSPKARIGWTLRGLAGMADRKFSSNEFALNAKSYLAYLESSWNYKTGDHLITAGITYNYSNFTSTPEVVIDSKFRKVSTPGVFIQDDWKLSSKLSAQTGFRADELISGKIIPLPSISFLMKWNEKITSRLGGGLGYRLIEPFNDEAVLAGDSIQMPNKSEENSYGFSGDVNYHSLLWKKVGFTFNQSFFLTTIQHFTIQNANIFTNADGRLETKGSESYVLLTYGEAELYLGYSYTYADYNLNGERKLLAYSPNSRFATVFAFDLTDHWKAGIEASYTASQKREDDTNTPAYWFTAFMTSYSFGKLSLTLNFENLNDYKQSNNESLFTGTITHPNFKYLWASTTGRVASLAVRYRL